MRFNPPRHGRSVRKRLLPPVQQKGKVIAAFLGNNHSPTYHVEQTDQGPVRSLNPGHNRPPGSLLYRVHFVRSVEWKEGAVRTAPSVVLPYLTTRSARSRSDKSDNLNLLRAST